MRETINKKTRCKNMLFATKYRSKPFSFATCFRSLLSVATSEFYEHDHLNHIRLTDELSVRKLRFSYLALFGEKEK